MAVDVGRVAGALPNAPRFIPPRPPRVPIRRDCAGRVKRRGDEFEGPIRANEDRKGLVIRRAVAAACVTEGSDVARSPTVGDAADGPAAHMHGARRNRGPFMIPADLL